MRIFLIALSIIASIIETVLTGIAYYTGNVQPAQTAFWLLVIFSAINILYVLTTGEPIVKSENNAGPRTKIIPDNLSRASLIFLTLGAFGGQAWALGWAFWIQAGALGFVLLALIFLGSVVAAVGDTKSPKRTNANDWRARV